MAKPSNKSKDLRKLRPEEEVLWTRVKRTIDPSIKLEEDFVELLKTTKSIAKPTEKIIAKQNKERIIEMPSYSPPVPKTNTLSDAPIDDPTAKKLVKGKVSIDGRIDLHGMTQMQAHQRLFNFVREAHYDGLRIILVITGKGNLGEGVLKREVPKWLSEPGFSNYVSGFRQSHITHGGAGALYVRIRKKSK